MPDSRFNALADDPRYRLPSRKEARTAVDPRFKTLFTDQEFRKKASVDRYGRKVRPETNKKHLEKLYRLDKDDEPKNEGKQATLEKEDDDISEEHDDEEDSDSESIDREIVKQRDPAREGGFSESESEEEEDTSGEEDESDKELDLAGETAGQEQTEDIPTGEVSRRIACVNLDWDNIRAADIMAVAQSFTPTGAQIKNVTIYPSEFGRERLEKEEIEGPPREIFASSSRKFADREADPEGDDDSDEEDEKIKKRLLERQASEGQEFDTAMLRQYQLERLRYFYAVISCDSKTTAKTLYDSMDGREYLSTSNFFDLRFIPDETSFHEDKPHDECDQLPRGYKPNDFRTEALTHSKVRLTWDDDDATRKDVQKRAFSQAEMDENDVQTYLASDDSDADSITSRRSAAEDRRVKKKEAQRARMREALGLGPEPIASSKKGKAEVVGDMQITFTSGLGGSKDDKGVFENEPQDEQSTRDRYIRKERERKQRRKEKMKATRQAQSNEEEKHHAAADAMADHEDDDDDPFNDPFFDDPETASKNARAAKSAARKAKHDAQAAVDAEAESRRAELELLMAGSAEDAMKHFDTRELDRAHKAAKRKQKKGKKVAAEMVLQQDDFQVDAQDPRFAGVFDSHEFAIDPTHARFKDTQATQTLREEQRRKRKHQVEAEGGEDLPPVESRKRSKNGAVKAGDDVRAIAARLKSRGHLSR